MTENDVMEAILRFASQETKSYLGLTLLSVFYKHKKLFVADKGVIREVEDFREYLTYDSVNKVSISVHSLESILVLREYASKSKMSSTYALSGIGNKHVMVLNKRGNFMITRSRPAKPRNER